MKMFRKREVPISDHIKTSFSPLINIFPWFGIFPLKIRRNYFQLYLRWSPWFSCYGYICGAFMIIVTLYVGISDSVENIVKMDGGRNVVNKMVTTFPMFGFCISSFFGVFYLATKVNQILTYFDIINQVDSIIKTKYNRVDKYKSLIIPLITLINTEAILYLNFLIFESLFGSKWKALKILFVKHLAYKINTHISLFVEYLIRLMAYNLELRFSRLNEVLQEEYLDMKNKIRVQESTKESTSTNRTNNISTYNKAYLKLTEAMKIINDLAGVNVLVTIISTFFILLACSFFIVSILGGKPQGHLELLTQVVIFTCNVLRVLIVTEPLYYCSSEIMGTARNVSNLLSLTVGRNYRRQVKSFAECVYLANMEFTACGFFNVDRLLIAEFIGGITNYVVILLGFKDNLD